MEKFHLVTSYLKQHQKKENGCTVPSPECWINLNTTVIMQEKKGHFMIKRFKSWLNPYQYCGNTKSSTIKPLKFSQQFHIWLI